MEETKTSEERWSNEEVESTDEIKKGRKRRKGGLLLLLIILIVVIAGIWFVFTGQSSWRAVFLTNNQVYFGHFKWIPLSSTITLKDVYYLQVSDPLQQGASEVQEVRVIKLGSEIHGPEDKMVIPKKSIMFWEDLKNSGAVVKRIEELKNTK